MKIEKKYYHGTDLRIVAMSDDERQSFLKDIEVITSYLWGVYEPLYKEMVDVYIPEVNGFSKQNRIGVIIDATTDKSEKLILHNLQSALSRIDCCKKDSVYYQYGDFYVTSCLDKAINYADSSFAFGEIGLNAYRLYQALDLLNIDISSAGEDIKLALKRFVFFAEAEPQPVVYELNDIDIEDLVQVNGTPVTKDNLLIAQDCIYKGKISFEEMTRVK